MDFRILGPLEVRDGDREVPLRAGKQRALLALLLVNANRTLAIDRIVDDLWGEDVPESAHEDGADLRLEAAKGADARGCCTRGRPATRSSWSPTTSTSTASSGSSQRPGRASTPAGPRRRRPVSVRRSTCGAGRRSRSSRRSRSRRPSAARLEELRLSALEGRLEADLLLGRHGDLVGELEALIARYPLREGLRRQHMLALYRSGRQAEALAAYQEARRALADELGIEPSPALRELERQHPPAGREPRSSRRRSRRARRLPLPGPQRPSTMGPPRATTGEPGRGLRRRSESSRRCCSPTWSAQRHVPPSRIPERTRALLDRFYDAMAEEIEAAGGTVEKFVGDAVMAAFGAPAAQEDHAERALHAALSMRRRLAERFGEALEVRIGVNTGEVVVGRSRAGSSFVTGDVGQRRCPTRAGRGAR